VGLFNIIYKALNQSSLSAGHAGFSTDIFVGYDKNPEGSDDYFWIRDYCAI
jgi:hypothetical protein